MDERRTLIRREADRTRADVMRGERSVYAGEIVEVRESGCESIATLLMGEDDWNEFTCELVFGHSGRHLSDEQTWSDDE